MATSLTHTSRPTKTGYSPRRSRQGTQRTTNMHQCQTIAPPLGNDGLSQLLELLNRNSNRVYHYLRSLGALTADPQGRCQRQ